jgi:hypothetical protein
MEKYRRAGHVPDDNIILRTRIAGWIPKATNTHSEYVIHIAFPLHKWLHERASMLRYTNASCPVVLKILVFSPLCNLLWCSFVVGMQGVSKFEQKNGGDAVDEPPHDSMCYGEPQYCAVL